MQHNPYFILNRKIDERYSRLRADYPLSFYYLETELRLTLTGQHVAQERNIKNIINKYSILRILCIKAYFLIHFIKLLKRKYVRRSIYISLNRHPALKEKLEEYISIKDYIFLSNVKSYEELFFSDKIFPLGWLAMNSLSLRKVHKKIFECELASLIENNEFMLEMEEVLRGQVQRMEKFMRLHALSGIILQNEHTFEEKIIVQAAHKLNIPVITVCHGYIQQSELVTIAPFTANYMVLWTQSQKEFLDNYNSEFKDRTLFLGWPFPRLSKTNLLQDRVLIILTDVDNDLREDEYLLTIRFLDNYIFRSENCRIRLHPASRKSRTKRVRYILDRYECHLDTDPLEASLSSARLVLGHDSSVLVTSVMNNIPTFRFAETAKAFMPEVKCLKMDDILNAECEDLMRAPREPTTETSGLKEMAQSIFRRLMN